MKKSALLLGVLAAGMVLCGCGENNDNSSSGDSGSFSSEELEERRAALANFIIGMGKNNLTLKVTGANASLRYYLGSDAFVTEDAASGSKSGILANKDQGFYYFTVNSDDTLTFSGCQGLGSDIAAYYITPYNVFATDDMKGYYDLSSGSNTDKSYVFKFDTTKMIADYTSGNSTAIYYLAYLLGAYDSSSSTIYHSYVTSLELTLSKGSGNASVKLKYKTGVSTQTQTATIYNVGTTTVKAVDDYLKNPETFEAPTDFTEASKKALNSVFVGHESDIVFPTGIVTAAYADSPLAYSGSGYAGLEWVQYGVNLTKKYAAMLVSKGYELDQVVSASESSDGYTHYYYTHEFSEQIEAVEASGDTAAVEAQGAIYIVADIYYSSKYDVFTAQIYTEEAPMYWTYDTIADANTKIAAINASENTKYSVPTLPESSHITNDILVEDDIRIYPYYYYYSYYYIFVLEFDTEENAVAYANSYATAIISEKKYVDTGKYSIEDDGQVTFAAPNADAAEALINVVAGKTSVGTYAVNIYFVG